jgi:hypothetical protein
MTKNHLILLSIGSALGSMLPTHAAARSCVDNFTQSDQKSQTFLETRGDANKALVTLARMISSEGFLGLTVNKDVGIVSAYQENKGKKSALSAAISEAGPGKLKVEASFLLAPGLRVPPAAMRDHLCKLVESTLSGEEQKRVASDTSNSILLKGGSSDMRLESVVGQHRKAGFGPVLLFFMDFSGSTASVRTSNSRPVLSVPAKDDPAKSFFVVKLDPLKDNAGSMRTLKIGSAGTIIRAAATGKMDLAPDRNWARAFSTMAESDGRWAISILQDLPPGEYGLWDAANGSLSPFGVD